MQLLRTQQELVALDLGMQAIAIRGAQVKADEDRDRIQELEARVRELEGSQNESPPDRGQATSGTAQTSVPRAPAAA